MQHISVEQWKVHRFYRHAFINLRINFIVIGTLISWKRVAYPVKFIIIASGEFVDGTPIVITGCGRFLGDRTKGLSYVQPRGTTARGGLVFHHADDHGQVVEYLGYPTRQCLERWLAKDPRYAGHMAKPIIPLETRTKAIELVLGGMRGSRPPDGSA